MAKTNARFSVRARRDEAIARMVDAVVDAICEEGLLGAVDEGTEQSKRAASVVVRSVVAPLLRRQLNRAYVNGFNAGQRDGQRIVAELRERFKLVPREKSEVSAFSREGGAR